MPERRIELTDDQYDRVVCALNSYKFAGEFLASLLHEFCEKQVKEHERAWDMIYSLAGVSRDYAGRVSVDWVNRCIIVREKDGDKTESQDRN